MKYTKKYCLNNLDNIHAIVARFGRQYGPKDDVLVVMQKDVETAIRALRPLPPNVHLGHHNNLRGLDRYRDVAALVVIGRTEAPAYEVERHAMALTGAAVAPVGWYLQDTTLTREMRDGSTVPAVGSRHPDPVAEAVRWQICEGELLQIIGRGRGVNRTADNPLAIWLLTDTVLPIPLDEELRAADLEPGPVDLMLARHGALLSPAHAARAYPDLFASANAAKKVLDNETERLLFRDKGPFPYERSLIRVWPLISVSYRINGERGAQEALVAPHQLDGFRDWLARSAPSRISRWLR
jgi:putative DNA primase/helicase